jgi:hypothetical protein
MVSVAAAVSVVVLLLSVAAVWFGRVQWKQIV